MSFKPLKFIFVWMVLFRISVAAFTPQFADSNNTQPIRWKNPVIRIGISTSLTKQNYNFIGNADINGAIKRSLETWEKAANIKFQTFSTEKQSVSPAGNSGDGISLITIGGTSENLLLFGNNPTDVSAQTRTFFNRKGLITEADIVLNPYQQFSTDGYSGTFDLEATLTHEIGHLLGLEHSFVMGATMYYHQGKNGVYDLPGFSPRTLAEDDITGIRALYGAKENDGNCCGEIRGRLLLPNGNGLANEQVWAEDADDGRLMSGVLSNADGEFYFAGLRAGKYRLYAQKTAEESKDSFSAEQIGIVEVENGKITEVNKKSQPKNTSFNLQFTGFRGQISELAVPVNGGKSYIIYIGGKKLDTEQIEMNFSSPNISVVPDSLIKYDYGAGISVVSYEVRIAKNTPLGEYGIFVGTSGEKTTCLAGSLTVEEFENNFINNFFDK
ncbi:hypothetical protein BH10ACI1_BH10ACI1_22890 [soil metagenome]